MKKLLAFVVVAVSPASGWALAEVPEVKAAAVPPTAVVCSQESGLGATTDFSLRKNDKGRWVATLTSKDAEPFVLPKEHGLSCAFGADMRLLVCMGGSKMAPEYVSIEKVTTEAVDIGGKESKETLLKVYMRKSGAFMGRGELGGKQLTA